MGIWDELSKVAGKSTNRDVNDTPSVTNVKVGFDVSRLMNAVNQVGDAVRFDGAQKLKQYVPNPDLRDKIGRILTNIGRFAVDSAVAYSFRGVTGAVQVYKIVKEGLKDQDPLSQTSNGNRKPELKVVMEEMQAKMEKMENEMNNMKQENKITSTTRSAKDSSDPLKESPGGPTGSSAPTEGDVKRVMIRSRL